MLKKRKYGIATVNCLRCDVYSCNIKYNNLCLLQLRKSGRQRTGNFLKNARFDVALVEMAVICGIIVKNNRWLSVKTTYGLVKSTNSRCIFPQNFCKMHVYQTKMPFGQIENDGFPSGGNYE